MSVVATHTSPGFVLASIESNKMPLPQFSRVSSTSDTQRRDAANYDERMKHLSPNNAEAPSQTHSINAFVSETIARTRSSAGECQDHSTTDEDACPCPIIRQTHSVETIGREAHKSRIPQFRQSRRWAKTYMTEESQPRPRTAPTNSSTSRSRSLSCKSSRKVHHNQSSGEDTGSLGSDSDSVRNGLCRSAAVPSWQNLKQAKILHLYAMPAKEVTISRSPKQRTMKVVETSEERSSGRRFHLPHKIRSKRHTHSSITSKTSQDTLNSDQSASPITQEHIAELEKMVLQRKARLATHEASSVPSLHDHEKIKRFSRECEALLSGHGVDLDWLLLPSVQSKKLSPLLENSPPAVSTTDSERDHPKDPSTDKNSSSKRASARSGRKLSSRPRDNEAGPDLPARSSSKGVPAADRSGRVSHASTSDGTRAFSAVVSDVASQPCSVRKAGSTASSLHSDRSDGHVKNARSVDTLTLIECLVNSQPSNTASKRPKPQRTPTRPSVHSIASVGAPPESPLPQLPTQPSNYSIDPIKKPMNNTSRHKRVIKSDDSNTDERSSMAGPSRQACVGPRVSSAHTMSNPCSTLENKVPPTENIKNTSRPPQVANHDHSKQEVQNSSGSTVPPSDEHRRPYRRVARQARLKSRDMTTERTSKIHEMKKRHIAALVMTKPDGDDPTRDGYASESDTITFENDGDCTGLGAKMSQSRFALAIKSAFSPPDKPLPPTPNKFREKAKCETDVDTKQGERGFIDELDRFPAVPTSRPCSRASAAAHLYGMHGTRGSPVRKSPVRMRPDSVGSRHQRRSDSTTTHIRADNQNPAQSQVLVIVDERPANLPSQYRSTHATQTPSKTRVQTIAEVESSMNSVENIAAEVENSCENIRSGMLLQKRSLTSLRGQVSNTYDQRPGKCSPTKPTHYRSASKGYFVPTESSESEEMSRPMVARSITSARASRISSSTNSSNARRSRAVLTAEPLGDKLQRAHQDLEIVKRYEKRILHLQDELEMTLKVWGKMVHTEHRTLPQDLTAERVTKLIKEADELASLIAGEKSSDTDDQNRYRTGPHGSSSRPISDSSTFTTASNFAGSDGRRGSDASLTDPQDYLDTVPYPLVSNGGASAHTSSSEERKDSAISMSKIANNHASEARPRQTSNANTSSKLSTTGSRNNFSLPVSTYNSRIHTDARTLLSKINQYTPTESQPEEHTLSGVIDEDYHLPDDQRLSVNHGLANTEQMDRFLEFDIDFGVNVQIED